jgi:hypothetical protein
MDYTFLIAVPVLVIAAWLVKNAMTHRVNPTNPTKTTGGGSGGGSGDGTPTDDTDHVEQASHVMPDIIVNFDVAAVEPIVVVAEVAPTRKPTVKIRPKTTKKPIKKTLKK